MNVYNTVYKKKKKDQENPQPKLKKQIHLNLLFTNIF